MDESGTSWASPFADKSARPEHRPGAGRWYSRALDNLMLWAGRVAEAIATALLRRNLRRLLRQLDDRMLDDIGLTRADVEAFARGEPVHSHHDIRWRDAA